MNSNGSKLYLIVPVNKVGSCYKWTKYLLLFNYRRRIIILTGIIEITLLKSYKLTFFILTLSINIFPLGSAILYKAWKNVDLPAPVWPIIPFFSFEFIFNVTFWRATNFNEQYIK